MRVVSYHILGHFKSIHPSKIKMNALSFTPRKWRHQSLSHTTLIYRNNYQQSLFNWIFIEIHCSNQYISTGNLNCFLNINCIISFILKIDFLMFIHPIHPSAPYIHYDEDGRLKVEFITKTTKFINYVPSQTDFWQLFCSLWF